MEMPWTVPPDKPDRTRKIQVFFPLFYNIFSLIIQYILWLKLMILLVSTR